MLVSCVNVFYLGCCVTYCSAYKVKDFWMIRVSKYSKDRKDEVLHSDKLMLSGEGAAGT